MSEADVTEIREDVSNEEITSITMEMPMASWTTDRATLLESFEHVIDLMFKSQKVESNTGNFTITVEFPKH